jgi:hypothetical protein
MKHITTFTDFLNEGINTKDIKVGTILNFKDGETWKVTKTPGISTGKIFAAPYGDTKKKYISLPIEFPIDTLKQDVKSLSESQVNEASAFMAKDVAKTAAFLNNQAGPEPGYLFFGHNEDIEDFDKLWKKRKYQEALDMLAQDREIEAQTFDDVKPWVKESVDKGYLTESDEVSVDKIMTPAEKKQLKNAFETVVTGIDKLTFKKDGTIEGKRGYFYKHGQTPDGTAKQLESALKGEGINIQVIDAYDDFKPWPKDSNFVVIFKLT